MSDNDLGWIKTPEGFELPDLRRFYLFTPEQKAIWDRATTKQKNSILATKKAKGEWRPR